MVSEGGLRVLVVEDSDTISPCLIAVTGRGGVLERLRALAAGFDQHR